MLSLCYNRHLLARSDLAFLCESSAQRCAAVLRLFLACLALPTTDLTALLMHSSCVTRLPESRKPMERSSRFITYIAFVQFVPLVLFPWDVSIRSLVIFAILLLLSAFLGWALIQRKPWGRTLTIFVQGLNIVVRIITFFGNVYAPETGLNAALLVTYLLAIILSGGILSYIDRPEVQLAFEA